MDKSEYFKKIWANGKLITGYSELKIFEKQTAIVFARINTEFNYAVGHKYLINNYCFAYDIQEIAESVALTVEEVNIAIQQLEHLNLIKTMVIKSFTLIHLNLENICNFIKQAEQRHHFQYWDYRLEILQKNPYYAIEKNNVEKQLITDIQNSDYEIATDENGNPLMF